MSLCYGHKLGQLSKINKQGQAHNQDFVMGIAGVWGRSPQPPEANEGLGAKPPAAGG